jgi:ATP-dependent Clp protease ATP-binding subunit ClpB
MLNVVLNPEAIGKSALELEAHMRANLIAQEDAIQTLVRAYQQVEAGFAYPDRPAGIFYLLGPTGVGKTRLVEVFSENLHGNPGSLIKIDCTEYQESHSVAKLIGAPPGYIGHDESLPAISQEKLNLVESDGKPSIVLFDEFDKAHRAVAQLILGVLDKGKITTNKGPVNFCNSFVIMTSNIGAAEMADAIAQDKWLTPGTDDPAKEIQRRAAAAMKKAYSPEFRNRLDAVLVFNAFQRADVEKILDLELTRIKTALLKHDDLVQFCLQLTPAAKDLILDQGYSPKENARYLKRAITGMLLQKLANLLASTQVQTGDEILVDKAGDRLSFTKVRANLSLDEMKSSLTT